MRSVSFVFLVALTAGALADDDPVASFKRAYEHGDEGARLGAVQQIAAIRTRSVVSALAGPVAKDASAAVRKAAAKALGAQYASALAAKELAAALHEGDPQDVQIAIVHALGETESDVAVPALLAALKTKIHGARAGQNTVAESSAILDALKRTGSCTSVGELVQFLTDEEPGAGVKARHNLAAAGDPLLKKADAALSALTGEHHPSPEKWGDWWQDHKESLKTVVVLRCEVTGKTYDRLPPSKPCPHCGALQSSCSFVLRTRFENVTALPAPAPADAKKKKP
ncbi:MAG TPA: HEAT repeat domain-containing protein [Planctomycetota bacterium]|nr:HEAT repeat domain-containing protein [Planctomycetota bacterium]